MVSEYGFRLCVPFGKLLPDQYQVVVQNMQTNKQTNKQRPFAEGPEADVRDGGIDLFTDFCPSYHKKLNNLDYLNMKLDYLKGTRPMRPMCIRIFFLVNNIQCSYLHLGL